MKQIFITVLALAAVAFANAQSDRTFKPFKVDIALGYALPAGDGSKAGALLAIEPKYALNDNLALGLRMEAAITAQGVISRQNPNADLKASGSYLITADYYLSNSSFRPFIGAGAGIYTNASTNATAESTSEIQSGSRFGYAPRVGFEVGHFRTAVEYNIAGKTQNVNHNYLGIKLSFFLGGGRYR